MSKQYYFKQKLSKSTQLSSIWLIDRALSYATTPGQNEAGSDGHKRVFQILQSSSITGDLDCLLSYPVYSLDESYSSAEMQSVYSSAVPTRPSSISKIFYRPLERRRSFWVSFRLLQH